MQACRLNKFLACRGVASRRACDGIIRAGRVRVNGATVVSPGARVMPGRDVVEVDGRLLAGAPRARYVALNKPAGVIVTAKDTRKRKAVTELIPPSLGRVFPVGRLDLNTEGLLLLTNDGSLAFRLTHPSFGVEKTYEVFVKERPGERALKTLEEGVDLGGGHRSSPAKVFYLGFREGQRTGSGEAEAGGGKGGEGSEGSEGSKGGAGPKHARRKRARGAFVTGGHLISLTICEGKKRQVRRMCKAVRLTVLSLVRTRFGPIRLGELASGAWRELTRSEVKALMACAQKRVEPSTE